MKTARKFNYIYGRQWLPAIDAASIYWYPDDRSEWVAHKYFRCMVSKTLYVIS